MTTGPAAGYPDWQSYAQWGAGIIGGQNFQAAAGGFATVYDQRLPQWNAVVLRVAPTSGSGTVNVQMRNPAGGGTAIASWSWFMTSGGPALQVVLPSWGSEVLVTITEGTGSASFAANFWLTAINQAIPKPIYLATQNTVVQNGVTVPASGNIVLPLPLIASGRCSINVNQAGSGTLAQIQLETLNSAGGWSIFALFDLVNTGRHFYDVALPGQAIRLKLLNTATVAVTNVYAAIWTDTD